MFKRDYFFGAFFMTFDSIFDYFEEFGLYFDNFEDFFNIVFRYLKSISPKNLWSKYLYKTCGLIFFSQFFPSLSQKNCRHFVSR